MMSLFDISFLNSFLANFFAAIVVAFLFFLLREKVFKIPDFGGRLYLRQITKETVYNPYKNMELQYVLSLRLDGSKVFGSAEKIYEDSSEGMKKKHVIHYEGKNRTICIIEGSIQKKYLSFYDLLVFHSFEENENRKSTTYYSVRIYKRCYLFGELIFKNGYFISTIASQKGSIEVSFDEFSKKKKTSSKNIILLD